MIVPNAEEFFNRPLGPTTECFSTSVITELTEGRNMTQSEMTHANGCVECVRRLQQIARLAQKL